MGYRLLGALALTLCFGTSYLQAQNPDYVLRIENGVLPSGNLIEIAVELDNSVPVGGWTYFVVGEDTEIQLASIVSGPTIGMLNGGSPPDTEILNQVSETVYQHSVVIQSPPGVNTLPVGTGTELSVGTYFALPGFVGPSNLELDSSPAFPPSVANAVLDYSLPIVSNGTVTVLANTNADYHFSFFADRLEEGTNDAQVFFDSSMGSSVGVISYGVSVELPLQITGFATGAATLMAQGGMPPDFDDLDTVSDNGFIHIIIVDFDGILALPTGIGQELAVLEVFVPDGFVGESMMEIRDDLGVPLTVIPLGGFPQTPGSTPYCLTTNHSFDRGDCNDDGSYNIADAVTGLEVVFGGNMPPCADACDANNSEEIDIADPIYIFNDLFGTGTPPPGQGQCAPDTGSSSGFPLLCSASSSCP